MQLLGIRQKVAENSVLLSFVSHMFPYLIKSEMFIKIKQACLFFFKRHKAGSILEELGEKNPLKSMRLTLARANKSLLFQWACSVWI